MLNPLFLLFAFACSDPEPPPAPEPEVVEEEPPPPKKKPRSGSDMADTGMDIDDLIKDVGYEPSKPVPHENVTVTVQMHDTDEYIDIDYEWEVNGRRIISERTETLPHRRFSKGDTVQAFLTIQIGSTSIERDATLVIVGNSPPRILTNPNSLTKLDGFRIRGEDPDGGAVTYYVKGGPPGLTIGETTGVVRYKQSKHAEGGEFPMTFIVRDEDQAESEWRLTVNVNAGSESESAKAARAKRKADWEAEQAAKKAKRAAEQAALEAGEE